ncbi:hypothetical protein [Natrinema amylolyticum]|uniref:hypothetical protein n=1 Tax=Natrinema amylolyticum TaxID=2878679 RepID=UPI001CFA9BED|nr:hypothetical protein [Natrinema amylolyticum]
MAASKKHESLRGDQLEREGQEDIRQRQIAEAVAGPDLRADGSGEENGHASTVNQPAKLQEERDRPLLHVGDHVSERGESDGPKMLVVRLSSNTASEYSLPNSDETVAEYNDCDPDEDVYQVEFLDRTTKDVDGLQRYPYPRSKLVLENPIHDRDDSEVSE